MIEWVMLLGIGFLAACLLTLAFIPVVHARAVRLTTRRHQDAMPTSVTEMQAEKDQLRAEFAMSTRRFEIALEEARTKAAGHLSEVGKKTQEIQLLKIEFGKAAADHLCEIVKKSEETQTLLMELDKLTSHYGHEPPKPCEENRGKTAIGRGTGDLCMLGKRTQEIQFPKMEFGKAAADHLSEIAKKAEETQNLPTELDRVTAQYGHEAARKPEKNRAKTTKVPEQNRSAVLRIHTRSVIMLQHPAVKWVASAAASFCIVSLLLLAPSSDKQDHQRRTAFILGGDVTAPPPTGGTRPALGEARQLQVAVIKRDIEQANPAMREREAVPRNIVIIRGGRRDSKPQ
jgi:hypothetical protein